MRDQVDDACVDEVGLYYLSLLNYFLHLVENECSSSRRRRVWMHPMYKTRTRAFMSQMLDVMIPRPFGFFDNFCRMFPTDFEDLLQKISPLISKTDTPLRDAIPAKIRLAVTLRFLATGDSFISLRYLFKISQQSISYIVPEVCMALIHVLREEVKLPKTQNEWKATAAKFENLFPRCIGAIDGKHVVLQSPINSGSEFYNYKRQFSIVLLAAVNAENLFMFADVGCQGRISDGGVLRNSILWEKMQNGSLNLPDSSPLPGRRMNVPYVFVADSAFALSDKILKPYPGTHREGNMKNIFNKQLSRARVKVENTFGIMASVFRVFRKPMLLQPDKASVVTMTCILLHNFLQKSTTSAHFYSPEDSINRVEGDDIVPRAWQNNEVNSALVALMHTATASTASARKIRDEYAEYIAKK